MSNRPNAIYARDVDGDFCLVADAKARRFLNKGFEKPRPRWGTFENHGNADGVCSPEYRALYIEPGPCVSAMLVHLFDPGCCSLMWCDSRNRYHGVTAKNVGTLRYEAVVGAIGTLPEHEVLQ